MGGSTLQLIIPLEVRGGCRISILFVSQFGCSLCKAGLSGTKASLIIWLMVWPLHSRRSKKCAQMLSSVNSTTTLLRSLNLLFELVPELSKLARIHFISNISWLPLLALWYSWLIHDYYGWVGGLNYQ